MKTGKIPEGAIKIRLSSGEHSINAKDTAVFVCKFGEWVELVHAGSVMLSVSGHQQKVIASVITLKTGENGEPQPDTINGVLVQNHYEIHSDYVYVEVV